MEKYSPVTEDMLLNPPANDWLMHYQNYAGWSHSPLKQINTKNVQNLQLRWVWSMEDGERQQITPLVHDGVMFVSTAVNNTVQALNAATGDLIWENRLGPRLENQVNATARAMAREGAEVAVLDRDLEAAKAVAKKIGGKAVENTYFAIDFNDQSTAPMNVKFRENYKKRYNTEPDNWAAVGYSEALLAARAIKDSMPNPTRETVRSRAPTLLVMIRTTCLKSAFFPLLSVSVPWSITCKRTE